MTAPIEQTIQAMESFPLATRWFRQKNWQPFDHQIAVWQAFSSGRSGLLNAPTGTGKTCAIWLPILEFLAGTMEGLEGSSGKDSIVSAEDKHSKSIAERQSITAANRQSVTAAERQSVTAVDRHSISAIDRQYITTVDRQSITTPAAQSKKRTALKQRKEIPGIRVLWITPLRALARDTEQALRGMAGDLNIHIRVLRRTGDTSSSVRQTLEKNPPDCLITTPESLHVMLSSPNHPRLFRHLDTVVVDEWHELLGSKRGVMTELGLAALRSMNPDLRVWGMSATIGNLDEALQVLCGRQMFGEKEVISGRNVIGSQHPAAPQHAVLVRSDAVKSIRMETILPDDPVRFPWAGHMGLKLLPKVIPVIQNSRTTLLFTNTRSQTEIWYQNILEACPDLAGQMAIHHGSIGKEAREWVEEAIRSEKLRLVISTSSLDLGVDFSPVETVIQVGSPKGVARYLQRAGRSGHQPGAESRIWFVPTHGMELIEAAALHSAASRQMVESREPVRKPFDVLLQFLSTLAAGGGFDPDDAFRLVRGTFSYRDLQADEWQRTLDFLCNGGVALRSYPDYRKLVMEDGRFVMADTKLIRRHRLSIGTIVDDPALKVQYLKGGYIGTVEESFITRMRKGDRFLFAGKWLEFVRLKDMTAYVRKSARKKGMVSRWMGGRMPLSSRLAGQIREQLEKLEKFTSPESDAIRPILKIQALRSRIPRKNELLVERLESRDGHHLFFYPVEGRAVHEGLASLVSWRISRKIPVTFSMAMNDFGFELLSDQPLGLDADALKALFSPDGLTADLAQAINASEMSRRHFRELARVSGLVFKGYPGSIKGSKHIQAGSEMLYDVFRSYDPDNLLLAQAASEVMTQHINLERITKCADRISKMNVILQVIQRPTPFCVPILVDRLRGTLTSEQLEDRIRKMQQQLISG